MEAPPTFHAQPTYLYHHKDEDGHDWGACYQLDLGDDHYLTWTTHSAPGYGTKENPITEDTPLLDKPTGAIIIHRRDSAPHGYCEGAITFDVPWLPKAARKGYGGGQAALWQVQSFDPLTVSPSLLCKAPVYNDEGTIIGECNDHGFIREGRWVRA